MPDVVEKNSRDSRILVSMGLLGVTAIMALLQAAIITMYLDSIFSGDWTRFVSLFNVSPPVEPRALCFDRCASELPLLPAWIGIVTFALSLAILAHCWLRPKSSPSAAFLIDPT